MRRINGQEFFFTIDAMSSFRYVFIHELIHAAGAPGKYPGWGWKQLGYDDLSYMQEAYDKIEEACGGNK